MRRSGPCTHWISPRPRADGLLAPAADGRRRPLLALRTLHDMSELVPFVSQLHDHLVRSALEPRGTQVDAPMLDMLLGCAFLPVPPAEAEEAEAALRPHLAPPPQSSATDIPHWH